jgi:hypothetical protein
LRSAKQPIRDARRHKRASGQAAPNRSGCLKSSVQGYSGCRSGHCARTARGKAAGAGQQNGNEIARLRLDLAAQSTRRAAAVYLPLDFLEAARKDAQIINRLCAVRPEDRAARRGAKLVRLPNELVYRKRGVVSGAAKALRDCGGNVQPLALCKVAHDRRQAPPVAIGHCADLAERLFAGKPRDAALPADEAVQNVVNMHHAFAVIHIRPAEGVGCATREAGGGVLVCRVKDAGCPRLCLRGGQVRFVDGAAERRTKAAQFVNGFAAVCGKVVTEALQKRDFVSGLAPNVANSSST